jgi:hypothetical protein
MSKLVFGSDPEFFAGYKQNNELFVLPPAYFRTYLKVPFIADNRHPIFIDAMDELGVIVMEDGVAFEETIVPDTDWKSLFERIQIGKKLLSDLILSKFPKECLPDVQTIPTINYDVERWRKESPEFKNCLIFGCDQDWDADNSNRGGKTISALKHPFRYGGGHIHISGSEKIKEEPILAVQSLKLTAGLVAVAFSDTPELDHDRTYLYGKPAKYRPQHYSKLFNEIPFSDFGIEYRTPSNRWTNSFEHAEQMFKWAEIGIRNLLEGGLVLELLEKINEEVRQAIINCDQKTAKELLSFVESRI